MAKPIGITPILEGKNAEAVLKRMIEPPTEKDIAFSEEIKKVRSKRKVQFKS